MSTLQNYTYHIDLNERGSFHAHVESPKGKIIYCLSNEDEDGQEGELPEVTDGFMKHCFDVQGLTQYLRDMQVIKPHDTVILAPGQSIR